MFSTYLRHMVYEQCIGVVFDRVKDNFSQSRNNRLRWKLSAEILQMADKIRSSSRLYGANYMVVSPEVADILASNSTKVGWRASTCESPVLYSPYVGG